MSRRVTSGFRSAAARRIPCASLLFVLAAVGIYVLPGAARLLEYDRAALARGELWRMVTCHWTHFSLQHLFWDALTLGCLGWACQQRSRRRFLLSVAGAAVAIPLVNWALVPGMSTYRGLSGLDSAAYTLLAVSVLRDNVRARRWGWVAAAGTALIALAAKIICEMATGSAVFVSGGESGVLPVPLAHEVGAAVGILAGLFGLPERRAAPQSASAARLSNA